MLSSTDHPNLSLPTHPYKLLMKSRIDLERYVMFVQVRSTTLLAACREQASLILLIHSDPTATVNFALLFINGDYYLRAATIQGCGLLLERIRTGGLSKSV